MREIVSILSHADTIDKEEILRNCVEQLKRQKFEIIISSHIDIPDNIKSEVDFVVLEKDNPLIYNNEFPGAAHIYIWQRYPSYYQNYPVVYNHSFAVLKLIKNSLGIAYCNNYEKVHFVNYDYVLVEDKILKEHSLSLNDNDLYSYYYDKFETSREHINTGLFSVRTEKFMNIFRDINTKEKFLEFGQAVFEKYVYYQALKNNLNIKTVDQESISHEINSLNKKSTFKNFIEDKVHFYLSKEQNTENYFIYINSTKGDRLSVELNSIKRWHPEPYLVNLLEVPKEVLREGLNISIPELRFKDILNFETNFASCEIYDRNIIKKWHEI